jgi:hypothetical protein
VAVGGRAPYFLRLYCRRAVHRWVVERSFAWLGRSRRLAKDYERQAQTSGTLMQVAMIQLMLMRLGQGQRPFLKHPHSATSLCSARLRRSSIRVTWAGG